MKSGALVGGAILLIFGFIIFWVGYSVVQQYSTSLGQLGMALSQDAQNQYAAGQALSIIGGILAFIGIIVAIYGAVASPNPQNKFVHNSYNVPSNNYSQSNVPAYTQTVQNNPVPTRVLAICPQCRNRIDSSNNFCPICGTDIRPNIKG